MNPHIEPWRPIETAPKDGTRILIWRNNRVSFGWWEKEIHYKKPTPHWSGSDAFVSGIHWARETPPSHWMPLPEGPQAITDKLGKPR